MNLCLSWTSVMVACWTLIYHTESRSIPSTVGDLDLILHPVEYYTVKPFPIPSQSPSPELLFLPTGPLNPSVMMHAKAPSPEEPVNNTGHRQLPRPVFLRQSVNDPTNFSTSVPAEKVALGAIHASMNRANKKSPPTSRLAGVIRGIYWMLDKNSGTVSLTPGEWQNQKIIVDAEKWIRDVKTRRRVVRMEVDQAHCGRNFLLHFDDGSEACAKQRRNYDEIQGEIFGYFLSDLLGMRHHLPPTVLVKAMHSRLFESVMGEIQQSPTWDPAKPFIITKYLTNLKPILLPGILHPLIKSIVLRSHEGVENRHDSNQPAQTYAKDQPTPGNNNANDTDDDGLRYPLISPRSQQLGQLSREELHDLLQWSDMVIFDYLTGNLDRLVNAAVNLQWHEQMLSLPVHNVLQTAENGNFIFMDNESGLFHGYRLLDHYDKYLQPLLRSFCVFNKSTVNAVKKLHQSRNAGVQMMKMLSADYPKLLNRLPGIGPKTSQILQKRLKYVYSHIRFCEENYFLP